MKIKKKYTRIWGVRIAHKGDIDRDIRSVIAYSLKKDIESGTIGRKGWWIKAKYSV